MSANLGSAYTHYESDVVLGRAEFLFADLRVASVFLDVLYLSECGTHRLAYDQVRIAVLDDFADLPSDLAAPPAPGLSSFWIVNGEVKGPSRFEFHPTVGQQSCFLHNPWQRLKL